MIDNKKYNSKKYTIVEEYYEVSKERTKTRNRAKSTFMKELKEKYPSQYYVLNILRTAILPDDFADELANLITNHLAKEKNNMPAN